MTAGRSLLSVAFLFLLAAPLAAQDAQMNGWFIEASETYDVPLNVLQAVGFVESRWTQLRPVAHDHLADIDREAPPPAYGVMGLRDDDHFGYSLRQAAALLGRTPGELKNDARLNILRAAALLHSLGGGATRTSPVEAWEDAVALYSGIGDRGIAEMYTYDVFTTILSGRATANARVAQEEVDLAMIYGADRLRVLSAPRLTIDVSARTKDGGLRAGVSSADYAPAVWDAAATCNYAAGRSATVTHVAEHIAQGGYAGTIAWFKDCAASVSAHYVVRSSDGQVTQMVREYDTAWHVAGHNSYSIGIEHEGYAENCAWYTTAMYNGSSALTRDIADSNGIPRTATYDASLGWDTELPQSSSFKIKGHTNFPTTKTCPGACFDWPRFRTLVIGAPAYSRIVDNATAGRFTASANWATSTYSAQRYGADYRYANPQAVSDAAWFKFDIPSTGSYEVFVWYAANAGYNSATPFVIATSSGNVTVNVNQQVNGGAWLSLGTYTLAGGDYNAVGVSRWTSGTGYVIADAVKVEAR
ncbi:MAG TPA: N-acetylmuramoyl-L-alanine amidase [Thermoanaerobaculia bacterium]|jgi:N-acetyl-anhydromuramyl-L-alanine amidase AmpD